MTNEPAGNASEFAFPWLAEHLASVDQQIRLAEFVNKSGETSLQVDLPNYISLHQYARELLLLLDGVERVRKATEDRVKVLELARALRAYRRPVGRPRKIKLPALGNGLLAAFTEPEKTEQRKGGRPREYPVKFLAELNAAVAEACAKRQGEPTRANISAGLTAVLADYAESKNYPPEEAARKAREIHKAWYRPLMKYRKSIGESVYAKSQNRPKNAPNFDPLSAIFERWQPAIHSGTHNAAMKGTHGRQTGKARARKR